VHVGAAHPPVAAPHQAAVGWACIDTVVCPNMAWRSAPRTERGRDGQTTKFHHEQGGVWQSLSYTRVSYHGAMRMWRYWEGGAAASSYLVGARRVSV
jgi:hypothetical protein